MIQENCFKEAQKEEKRYKKQRKKYEIIALTLLPIGSLWIYLLCNTSRYGLNTLWLLLGGFAFFSITSGILQRMKQQNIRHYNRTMKEIERISLEDKIKNAKQTKNRL